MRMGNESRCRAAEEEGGWQGWCAMSLPRLCLCGLCFVHENRSPWSRALLPFSDICACERAKSSEALWAQCTNTNSCPVKSSVNLLASPRLCVIPFGEVSVCGQVSDLSRAPHNHSG